MSPSGDLAEPRGVRPALWYAALALAAFAGEIALATQREALLLAALDERPEIRVLAVASAAALALLFIGGGGLFVWTRRLRRRTPGRARIAVLGFGGALHVVAIAAAAALYAMREPLAALDPGSGIGVAAQDAARFDLALAVAGLGAALLLTGATATWFLLANAVRRRLWIVVDALLFVAVGVAIWRLPARPPVEDARALALPVLRHALTTLGVLRLTIRLVPAALDLVEALGFQTLVAARHLRSEKSGFLAAIGLLSVLAVSVSCMALTSTLSVMGGFRNDLKRKILGNNAHVVVDLEHGTIEDWEDLLATAARTSDVTGIAPFVQGEVMLSSASNLSTAVLRGIDPDRVGEVNDLPRNMRSGKLEYLKDPAKLLELPPDALQPPWLRDSILRPEPDPETATALPDDAARPDAGHAAAPDAGLENVAAAGPDAGAALVEQIEALQTRISKLEEFLREPTGAETAEAVRDVLPGIIVGQELARALRLFVGDEVNVVAPLGALGPSGPMPKSRPFRVAGIFYSGMYEYDMKQTYVALADAQRFLGVEDAVSGIEVRVSDIDAAPQVAAALRAGLGREELRVRDWQELNSRLFGALALEKLAMFVALGIAILVASFCIAGTLTLMVQEKGREVAILKAMGARDRTIVGVFVVEGGLIGLFGAALGLFLGYMACFAAEHFGIRMNPEVYYIDRLPVHIDPTEFLWTGIAAIAICLFITLYPALLASRLRPVDALRYE